MYQVTGNTFPVKDRLKALGCRWNSKARAWETANPATYQQALAVVGGVRRGAPAPRAPRVQSEDIRIEFPSRGRTYCEQEYGVYKYGVYGRSSVLAGQQSRQFLGSYPTEAEAQAAHPTATPVEGCGYQAPYLGHLSDEEGSW